MKSSSELSTLAPIQFLPTCMRVLTLTALLCFGANSSHAQDEDYEPQSGRPLIQETSVGPISGQARGVSASTQVPALLFEHVLELSPYAGHPSTLVFSTPGTVPHTVRALFTLDDKFLVLPARAGKGSGQFEILFPTPKKSLVYQFQIFLTDGRVYVTERYQANPYCPMHQVDRLIRDAEKFDSQRELLGKLAKLEGQVKELNHIVQAIDELSK